MIDESTRYSMLLDYYGGLLTEKQQEVTRLYHDENMSLSEIGEEFGISRQGVHDTLKKAEAALNGYEEKLSLTRILEEREQAIKKIDGMIDELMEENVGNNGLKRKMTEIKRIIDNLEE
ncbi:MAG: sigma factor-like helix-turn-helix DNA-binding protein [Eubacteriaceae bacterium]|nr:sigma factor-like helix-turn-helix DNA-binding protein [Eubacteriaceae bacterium]